MIGRYIFEQFETSGNLSDIIEYEVFASDCSGTGRSYPGYYGNGLGNGIGVGFAHTDGKECECQ